MYQSVFRGVIAQTCSGDLEAGMEWKPVPDWLLFGCFFPYSTFICDIGSLKVQWRQMMRRGLELVEERLLFRLWGRPVCLEDGAGDVLYR